MYSAVSRFLQISQQCSQCEEGCYSSTNILDYVPTPTRERQGTCVFHLECVVPTADKGGATLYMSTCGSTQ